VDQQSAVLDFMKKHKRFVRDSPGLIPHDEALTRIRLVVEEMSELVTAIHEGDLVGIADALGDSMYVILGTANAYGILMEDIMKEIHESNMSKDVLDQNQKGGKGDNFRPPNIVRILDNQIRIAKWKCAGDHESHSNNQDDDTITPHPV
jgi:phosphoribosyl-ATP pyrophosphohydrolase